MTDLITVALISGALAMPPREYLHQPTVPYRIERVSPALIAENCGPSNGKLVLGCYVDWYRSTIFIRNDLTPDAQRLVLMHEIGHVNGWEHGR
jgi:Zn-dependent peptidase ImmA (M78 family)